MKTKCLILALFLVTGETHADYNSLAHGVLNTDLEQVISDIQTVELPTPHKYNLLEIAQDIVKTKRAHFTFDWLKAFFSTKLLYSAFTAVSFNILCTKLQGGMLLQRIDPEIYKRLGYTSRPVLAYSLSKTVEWVALAYFTLAVLEGNTYYQELQHQLSDAEAIKLILMNSVDA